MRVQSSSQDRAWEQAFSRPAQSSLLSLPDAVRAQSSIGFLELITPLIQQARDQVQQGVRVLCQSRPEVPFDAATVEASLLASLPERLLKMVGRTMVLELNVARLEGRLSGKTAQERFSSFVDRIRQRDACLELLREYPVMARQIVISLDQWATFSLEFLRHLCADWDLIRSTFLRSGSEVLAGVDGGAGDRHRNGRSVLIASFSGGTQLVYKPRSMAVDLHFQQLLTWLNHRLPKPGFRSLRVLDRGKYGWTEFISAQSCAAREEVLRFYERQGGYLALLYALEATDFHYENLVAAGEHPMLIDLEALFHPRLAALDSKQADHVAAGTISYSVLKVGLLPHRSWSEEDSNGVDLSGLGGAAGQFTPHKVPHWEGAGTDEMRLARKHIAMPGGQNRPALNGAEVKALDHVESIATGFAAVYRTLLNHRQELLPLVACFAQDEVRVIVRGTQTYGALLYESFHPDVLRNEKDRELLFDRLQTWTEDFPALARLISAEKGDLLKGDIPFFTTRPSSRDVWNSSNEAIKNYVDEPGMVLVQRRIKRLSERDLEQQLWIIRASLATLASPREQPDGPRYRSTESKGTVDRQRLVAAASAVGSRLEELALRGDNDVSWLGLTPLREREWCLAPLSPSLYDGLPGLILFLAHLGAVTGQDRFTAQAKAALSTLRSQVDRSRSMRGLGAFNGWGGVIYALAHLGSLWSDPALFVEAQDLAGLVPALIESDTQLDIIGGAAGCINCLVALHRCIPSDGTLFAARQCGDHLIRRAKPMTPGIGWLPEGFGPTPLTGFAHGNAGIAYALLELAELSGEERFRSTALDALAYERSLFSAECGNWPDLRFHRGSFAMAWCHGAPGIGLARLRSLRHVDDPSIRAEIDSALKVTLEHGFGRNHALCHGDLGNVELLLQAGETLGDSKWHAHANRIVSGIIESVGRDGWICANPVGLESPGFMTGLAGIGYGLLRMAEPERVPSILTLAPPLQP